MISRSEVKKYANMTPAFDDITISLRNAPKMPKAIVRETQKAVAIARKFSELIIQPGALKLDKKIQRDPGYLPLNYIRKANEIGFYSMFIPKAMGGKGFSLLSLGPFVEELATSCMGIANLIMDHYLAISALSASLNMVQMNKMFRLIRQGEKTGEPCIFSTAITEPDAGTDVLEMELLDKGIITCHAKKVDGGYMVNGSKVFISNGHVSTWHIIIACTDINKPSENRVLLAIKNGTNGFSFGRVEKKMGQKACPASELIFNNCFIADEFILSDTAQAKNYTNKSVKKVSEILMADILSASQTGIGAFGAGAARGAYQGALTFASETEVDGILLINHEWAQCMLAEMYKNAVTARLTYMESSYANGLYGFLSLLHKKPVYYYLKYSSRLQLDKFMKPVFNWRFSTWLVRKLHFLLHREEDSQRVSGLGSLTKFTATDLGMKNCHMALEMMGQTGIRHDNRMEKQLRDAKLLQIYKGTNQLNRLNLFKCLIGRDIPGVRCFEKE